MPNTTSQRFHLTLLITLAGVFAWSMIRPYEWSTWAMEVAPAVIGTAILLAGYRRFPLTSLTYFFIWFFSIILIIGGHYTYAKMPLFDWIRDHFDLSRNHYDRVGHFFQGVTPALLTREVLLRTSPLRPGKWLFFLVTCAALAISASYELIEWLASEALEQGAESFVGSQGDIWDAQKDMGLCLCGAIFAQGLFGSWQTHLIEKLDPAVSISANSQAKDAAP